MQQTFRCPGCGSQNAVRQQFCGACGWKLQHNCPVCGGIIVPASRFCMNCGAAVGGGEPQPPVWMPQQPQWAPPLPRSRTLSAKPLLVLMLVILVLGLSGFSYWALGSTLWNSSVLPSNPQSYEQPPASPPSKSYGQPPASQPNELSLETESNFQPRESYGQPPYIKAQGERVNLVNTLNAKDVSFAELKSFILKDNTDDETYIPDVRTCGDFAEALHNNAERAGIRAAFVAIKFQDGSYPHALDGFRTTDRGLVYVDCTGKGMKTASSERGQYKNSNPCEYDKVAYIRVGKEYGVISIDRASSLQYSFFTEYASDWQKYEGMLRDYNADVQGYNKEVSGKVYYEGSSKLAAIEAWKAELAQKKQMIDELAAKLGTCWFEPMGAVESVEIYW